jgi:CDGSH-type Zn-finger protein
MTTPPTIELGDGGAMGVTAASDPHRRPVSIVCCPDGPFLVRGADSIVDESGQVHKTTRPVVAVCRCGKSARQPWCDGTHKVISLAARKRTAE